jgi:predicted RNase H-like nuclease (RuvC/YqgF family)
VISPLSPLQLRLSVLKSIIYLCSVSEVLQALSAALEVNEHLKREVEDMGTLVQSLNRQLSSSEERYKQVSEKLRELERIHKAEKTESIAASVRFSIQALFHKLHRPCHGKYPPDLLSTIVFNIWSPEDVSQTQ